MDWNSSHLFMLGRKPSTEDSVHAAQHVTQMLNDMNFPKDRKGPLSSRSPTMSRQHISQGRMNGLKTSQTPVTRPLCQGSLMQMVSFSLEAINKSMMNPMSGSFVQNIASVQEPRASFGPRKASGFANNPPVVSLPFLCGPPVNNEYFQPINCTPYGIPNQSFLSLYDGSWYQHEGNFIDPFYFNYCNSTNLNPPPPKKSYKLNPEAAEYIPKTMRLTDSRSAPLPVSLSYKKDIITTSVTDDQHVAIMAESPKISSCEHSPQNAFVAQLHAEKKAESEEKKKSVLCRSDSNEVSTACNVPSSVNIRPVVLQNEECCRNVTQKEEVNASSINLDRPTTPGGRDVERNSTSSMKVHSTVQKLDPLESCITPSSLECNSKNPVKTETEAGIASSPHALHSNIEDNSCAPVNNTHNNPSFNGRTLLADDDYSDTSDDDFDDCDSSSSSDSSSSDDESEDETDDFEEEEEEDDDGVYFNDDAQSVDPSKPIFTENLCESNKQKDSLKESEAEGTKEKDSNTNTKKTDFGYSPQAGWAILSYILTPASISEDSDESEEEEEEEDDSNYDCELFNLELDDAWDIPMGSLVFSNIISQSTDHHEISETPKSSNTEKVVDEVDASKIYEESTTLNDDQRNAEIDQDWERSTKRKVQFSDHVETHFVENWCRRGMWEDYARDRMRFRTRIDEMESVLRPVLNPAHRWKVFHKLKQ